MKKITALFLLFAALFIFTGCDKEYPPVQSSELELTTVMTVSYDGEEYDVKYELYRALFLNFKNEVDGGDETVWTGENKDEYIKKADGLVKERVAEIYSVFHTAKKIGIDVYSSTYDTLIKNAIKASVEGGSVGGSTVWGYDGDYDAYLDSLKKMNLNYSVQTLLLRYAFASEDIERYYAGEVNELGESDGHLKYSREDIQSFYESGECVRVIRAFLPMEYYSESLAQQIRDTIASKSSDEEVGNYIISVTLSASDIKDGMLIATNNLDRSIYGELTDAAFKLKNFETSEVIPVITGDNDGYMILYRTLKTEDYFNNFYTEVVNVYLENEIGKIIDSHTSGIIPCICESDFLKTLDRSSISME